jgi:ADP-heptose:LPS heptosyltransferase
MIINKILISRTDGIGDLLLTTPLMAELKKKYPAAKITVLAGKYAKDVLLNNPSVDEIITYDRNEHKKLFPVLKREKFDAVIAAYPRPKLAWDFFAAGIPARYGTAGRWYSFLYNKPVIMSRKKSEKSEADYNIMTAGGLLDNITADKEYYFVTPKENAEGAQYLAKKSIVSNFIIVHPGSKGSAWNLSEIKYVQLTNALLKEKFVVLLTGGSSEKEMLLRIKEQTGEKQNLYIMDEGLDLRGFSGVISHASVIISGSTGPMHIAAAIGVKTMSFFPPDNIAAMKPKRWAPIGNCHEIIQPQQHLDKKTAMDTIDIGTIIIKLKELISK